MNNPSTLLVPVALSAVTAAVVAFAASGSTPAPAASPESFRPAAGGDLSTQVAALQRTSDELTAALDALSLRFTTLEMQAQGDSREAAHAAEPEEMTEELAELAAALSSKEGSPRLFDDWLEGQLAAREEAKREARRTEVQTRLDDMLAERIDDLAERLELAPHQTTEVQGILSNSIVEVSSILAEADSPIDIMRGMAPIQKERNAQLEAVLTPEQFSSFQEEESSFRRQGFPFGGGTR